MKITNTKKFTGKIHVHTLENGGEIITRESGEGNYEAEYRDEARGVGCCVMKSSRRGALLAAKGKIESDELE